VYIDDYAHHPREIDALINGVRGMYPSALITGIFQPHLYSRTRDFAADFARSLEKLDVIVLTDLYPAREKPIQGIDSEFLLGLIKHPQKYYCPKKDLLEFIENLQPSVLLTIGAGDIDMFGSPIEDLFIKMGGETR
jgi:UDP-N-acetylmuramate--alanine ligase